MARPTLFAAAALGAALAAQDPATVADATFPLLDDATFDPLWQHVVPKSAELEWRRVPWLAQLAQGVVEAQRTDRPLLLWAMNGHPLACT
jgi:hypothetical protein